MNRCIPLSIVAALLHSITGLWCMESSLDRSLTMLSKSLTDLATTLQKPASKHPAVPAPFTFTFATCNVLFHQYYNKNFNGDKKKQQEYMDEPQRLAAFEAALQNQQALGNLDIICFQEWDYSNPQWEITLKKYYPNAGYWHIKDAKATKDGVYTVINRSKFSYNYTGDPFVRNLKKGTAKEFSWILLEIIETPHKKIPPALLGIINAHLPHALFDAAEFKKSLEDIEQKYMESSYKLLPWIVCGDFNFDILNPQNLYTKLQLHFNSAFWSSSYEQEQSNPIPTSYSQGPQYNDYIFYKTNHLQLITLSHYPIGITDLIKHTAPKSGEGAWYSTNYFSDHAIVRATFELR